MQSLSVLFARPPTAHYMTLLSLRLPPKCVQALPRLTIGCHSLPKDVVFEKQINKDLRLSNLCQLDS